MTQIDPRSPKATTRTAEVGEPPRKQEPPFNWRVSVGLAVGLLVLFGVLFGLRALDIFPPKPAEDPQIAADRAPHTSGGGCCSGTCNRGVGSDNRGHACACTTIRHKHEGNVSNRNTVRNRSDSSCHDHVRS